jgi:integrase/recombinase XerD
VDRTPGTALVGLPSTPTAVDQLDPQSPAERVGAAFLVRHPVRTRDAYANALRTWSTWCSEQGLDLLAVQRAHVERWLRHLEEQGRSPATRAQYLSALSGYYAEAIDLEVVARNPVARIRRPKTGQDSPRLGLDVEEVRRLLHAAARAGPRDAALTNLLLHCGLRISEALGLTMGDLSTSRGHRTARVVRKGGATHQVPLPAPAAHAVDALLADRRLAEATGGLVDAAPLFVDTAGRQLDRFDAGRIVRRLARAAGLQKAVSPHSLRHSFVTLALDAGVPLRDVQDSAGHADPKTTRRYDRGRHSLDRFAGYAVAAHVG